MIITALLPLIISSSRSQSSDITTCFTGYTNGGTFLAIPSDSSSRLYNLQKWPYVTSFDFLGRPAEIAKEMVIVALLEGKSLRSVTASQASTIGPMKGMVPAMGESSKAIPLAVLSANSLLVQTVSAGYGVGTARGKKHLFGISLIRFNKRGLAPNVDAEFPRDELGWYQVVDVKVNDFDVELLVGHSSGRHREKMALEAFSFSNGKLKKLPRGAGTYGWALKETITLPTAKKESMFRRTPYESSKIAVDSPQHLIASSVGQKILLQDVRSGKSVAFARDKGNEFLTFINGRLLASYHSGPLDYHTVELHKNGSIKKLGHIQIVGRSANGKVIVIKKGDGKFWLSNAKDL